MFASWLEGGQREERFACLFQVQAVFSHQACADGFVFFLPPAAPRRVCRNPYSIVRLFWTLFRFAPSAARAILSGRALAPRPPQGPNVWTGSEIVRIAERMQAGTGHAHLVDPVRILCAAWGTQIAASLSVLGQPVLHGSHRHAVVHAVPLHKLENFGVGAGILAVFVV